MRLIHVAFVFLPLLIISIQCQQTAEYWLDDGFMSYTQGEYDEAIKAYDKAIRLNPSFVEAWINKGNVLCMQDKYEQAIKCYDKALKLDPKKTAALNNKVNALNKLGRTTEANATIVEAENLSEAIKDWVNKGVELSKQGEYDEAIKAYNEALKLDPGFADAWGNKGAALCQIGKYDEALKAYDEFIRLNPNDAKTWIAKGVVLYNLSKYDDAINAYDEAIRLEPKFANAWYNKGNALCGQGRYKDAIKAYNEALRLDPSNFMALTNKDAALRNQSKYDDVEPEDSGIDAQINSESEESTTQIKTPPDGRHTYIVGTPDINEFILNWTDDKVYSGNIRTNIVDGQIENNDYYFTNYYVQILNESGRNDAILSFFITWHPSFKRPSTVTLEDFPYRLETDGVLSRSEITIQGKKALMLAYKEKKEYLGSKTEPLITPAYHLVRYFLDDYTEIRIEGKLHDWQANKFKSMLNSLKITPPEGYY